MATTRQPDRPVPHHRGRDRLPGHEALADRTGALLAAHVPLSLLLDLADVYGPHSGDLFTVERGLLDWLPPSPRPSPTD